MYQFDAVTEARTVLLATLRRVIDGGDVTNDELDAAIIAPADLRGAERKAWHGLSYWADDDIRAKDPAYALSRTWQLSAPYPPWRMRRAESAQLRRFENGLSVDQKRNRDASSLAASWRSAATARASIKPLSTRGAKTPRIIYGLQFDTIDSLPAAQRLGWR
jgi:hypothetical protein